MAGHSKWANIKHKKGKADAARGKLFSRITKEIISAVKTGKSTDPKVNSRLRLALQKAKAANMPNDNIERNIKKAASSDQGDYSEIVYELYGHGGVGIIAETMTDNKNRLASEIRIACNKCGGSVANPGAVTFNFDKKGVLQLDQDQGSEDDLFLLATEAGAEDFEIADEVYMVTTDPQELYAVKEKIEAASKEVKEATLEMIPKVSVACDEETQEKNQKLIDWLEGIEDVDCVFHNMEG